MRLILSPCAKACQSHGTPPSERLHATRTCPVQAHSIRRSRKLDMYRIPSSVPHILARCGSQYRIALSPLRVPGVVAASEAPNEAALQEPPHPPTSWRRLAVLSTTLGPSPYQRVYFGEMASETESRERRGRVAGWLFRAHAYVYICSYILILPLISAFPGSVSPGRLANTPIRRRPHLLSKPPGMGMRRCLSLAVSYSEE